MRPSSRRNSPHRGAPSPCRHSFPESCRYERPHRPIPLLPTLADIEAAAQVVYRDFAATPQYRWGR